MNRIIKLAISRPLICITLLAIITGVFFFGLKDLRVEPSTEALMPKHVEEYRYNMRMKKVFGDSKLYLLSLIEAREGELLTYGNFELLNETVQEIEEFHNFAYHIENHRLESLIQLGAAGYEESETIPQEDFQTGELSDKEIDALLMEENGDEQTIRNDYFDVFAIAQPIPDDMYVQPLRSKRTYSYDNYTPFSLAELEEAFDRPGRRQLNTVLNRTAFNTVDKSYVFSKEEYALILNEFETAYINKSMEAVKGFMNPISGEDIVGTEDSLTPEVLVEEDDSGIRLLPENPEDFASYRKKLLKNPIFDNTIYTTDESGRIQALALNIQLQVMEDSDYMRDYLLDVFDKYNSGNLEFTPVGVPVFEYYIQKYMKKDMKKFMPLVLLVVIITFLLNFKMVRGVLLPTVSILLSIIWTMGLMGFLEIPLTMVVNILPTILVAVGSSYSIHIFNQYLHDQSEIRKLGKRKGLVSSMSHISGTVFLAALTTFIGFSTLGFNQVVSLKHFGIFSAIGTLFTMLIASVLIPAVLSLSRIPRGKKAGGAPDRLQRFLGTISGFVLKNSRLVLAVSAMILLISIIGVSRLQIESSPSFSFKDDSYVVKADKKVSQALKGSIPINLMIDTGRAGGVKDPEFLKKLDELAEWAINEENRNRFNLLSSYTFCDIIKRMNMAMNSDDPAFYTIPKDAASIKDYLMLYSGEDRDSDGLPDSMERFTDPQYRVANIFIKTGYYDGRPYSTKCLLQAINTLEDHLDSDSYFSKLSYETAGQTINYAVLNKLIARGQLTTIILTLIIINIIIFIMFRDIKAALVSLIPISSSILVVFGIMGFFNIPLDIVKSIIAAVTIGIGIDDTIHMLKTIRYYLAQDYDLKEAIQESYREAGKAIIYTSAALICGFGVLMLSEFKVLYYLGFLVALNMITTTISALVVLPAAIWILKIHFNTETINNSNAINRSISA